MKRTSVFLTIFFLGKLCIAQYENLEQLLKNNSTLKNNDINGMSEMVQQMMKSQQNVQYDKSYTFNLFAKIKTETTNKGKKSTNTMELYSADNASMMKHQEAAKNMNIIMDNKNASMITLDEVKKEGYVMSINGMDKLMQQFANNATQEETDNPTVTIKKTGNSKTIAGYKCEEYDIVSVDKDDQYKGNIWVSNDAKINYFNIFSGLGKSFQAQCKNIKSNVTGAVLETNGKYSKTGEAFNMTVLELNQKSTTKNLNEYKINSGLNIEE